MDLCAINMDWVESSDGSIFLKEFSVVTQKLSSQYRNQAKKYYSIVDSKRRRHEIFYRQNNNWNIEFKTRTNGVNLPKNNEILD